MVPRRLRTRLRPDSRRKQYLSHHFHTGCIIILLFYITFNSAETLRPPQTVYLTNKDFVAGTLIISRPGRYVLAEDISFRPNSVSGDSTTPEDLSPSQILGCCNPLSDQLKSNGGPYDDAAYGLGFFSAIAVVTDNVEIDLNCYILEQSEEHALMQRFFPSLSSPIDHSSPCKDRTTLVRQG